MINGHPMGTGPMSVYPHWTSSWEVKKKLAGYGLHRKEDKAHWTFREVLTNRKQLCLRFFEANVSRGICSGGRDGFADTFIGYW